MALINSKQQLETACMEIKESVRIIETKIANVSNAMNDLSINAKGEYELIEQTIGDIAKVSANQVARLKIRLNAHMMINRLPDEILTHIIFLTNTQVRPSLFYPYILYTWVCHRWRSVLIQNSACWTVIGHQYSRQYRLMKPMYEELLRRSKSAKLDIQLFDPSVYYVSTLKKLFAEESDRIRSLELTDEEDLLQLVLSSKQLPSLQRLALDERNYNAQPKGLLISLVPVLVTAGHLETLQCSVWDDASLDQLAPIFSRIRHLSLYTRDLSLAPKLFNLLHNSTKLQTLKFTDDHVYGEHITEAECSPQISFPELLFLSIHCLIKLKLLAPKILSLNAAWDTIFFMEGFDFSPIKYLYIRDSRRRKGGSESGLCLLGVKERMPCGSLFSQTSNIFYEDCTSQVYPRNCFHLNYGYEKLVTVLQKIALILPQLTGLVEVHFLITHSLAEFEGLITCLPSVEKLVVKRGAKLLDVIRLLTESPPLSPRLKHLYFKTFLLPRNLEKYVNDVGKSLANCLQSRQKDSANKLGYLDLRNCPPLPDYWLKTLEDLGTVVVTESSVKNIKIKVIRGEWQPVDDSPISDVESDAA